MQYVEKYYKTWSRLKISWDQLFIIFIGKNVDLTEKMLIFL